MLMRPDYQKQFTLEVDASQYALRAILYQCNKLGKLQPVGYYSKTLIPAERNYNVYDRELLAVVQGLQHWQHLLLGTVHPTIVYTDHDNLTKYRHAQNISRRVSRYIPVVAEYNIQLHHKPGVSNCADALSRPPGTDKGSEDNQDMIVLPDHLFCRTLTLEELEATICRSQKDHAPKLEEWGETYGIVNHRGTWTMNGRAIIPDDQELR
jgi:hypothetical protein